jgi:hypothetical protein
VEAAVATHREVTNGGSPTPPAQRKVEQQLQCPVLEQARSPARRRSGGARSGFGRARAGCVCEYA